MSIVIDIEKKVNSEIAAGHITSEAIDQALSHYSAPRSELCKLVVTDSITEAMELHNNNRFVIPLLTENNSHLDFSKFRYLIAGYEDVDEDYYYKIWQRYLGLPWHILDTANCIIREMTPADVKALYTIYDNPDITRYTEPLFPDYEDELEYTHNYIHNVYEYFGFGTWVIIRKSDGILIGRAGFNYRPGYDIPEIGYVFGSEYQRQGYASEVCSAIIQYGFDELEFDRILAFSSPENTASLRLLNRLGFTVAPDMAEPEAAAELGFDLTAYILKK